MIGMTDGKSSPSTGLRKKYAGLTPSEMTLLRQLEEENGKLRKIAADLSHDNEMLQDVIRRKL